MAPSAGRGLRRAARRVAGRATGLAAGVVRWRMRSNWDRLAREGAGRRRRRAFRRLVRANRDTLWGRERGFGDFRSMDDFLAHHPVTTYADYRPLVEGRVVAEGVHEGVLRHGPIGGLFKTSGTTAAPKLVPFHFDTHLFDIHRIDCLADRWPARALAHGGRRTVLLGVWRDPLVTPHGLPIHTLGNGQEFVHVPALRRLMRRSITAPLAVFSVGDYGAVTWLHALFALRRADVRQIQGAFVTGVVDFFRTIDAERDALVEAIRTGRLPARISTAAPGVVPPLPDPARADAVRAALADGMEGFAPRVWPGLERVRAIATGSFAAHLPLVRSWLGDVPVVSAAYAASEGVLGYADREPDAFVPNVASHFFEFLPAGAPGDASAGAPPGSGAAPPGPGVETEPMEELVVGRRYEPVVTTAHGLYRYRTGDRVEVVGWKGELPLMSVLERVGAELNLRGEKASVATLAGVLTGLLPSTALVDFTVVTRPGSVPPGYEVVVELREGGAEAVDPAELARSMDAGLSARESGYAEGRERGLLAPLRLARVGPGAFDALRRSRSAATGTAVTRYKTPRLLTPEDEEALALLERHRLGDVPPG